MTPKPRRASTATLAIAAGLSIPVSAHWNANHNSSTIHPLAIHQSADRIAAPGELALETKRMAIFKDGYALVVKGATGTADSSGRVFTDQVPEAAVLGCFWATSDAGDILAMRAEFTQDRREEIREESCLTIADVLRASAGGERPLTIGLNDTARTTIKATVVRMLEATEREVEPAPGAPEPAPVAGTVRAARAMVGGQLVVLRVEAGELVLPVSEIRTVQGEHLDTTARRAETVKVTGKRLSFDLGPASAGKPANLTIAYFTPGVRWIPTYRLSMNADNKSGRLALQGEVLNELEDLGAVATDLVVGVPNFQFRSVVSPLSLERTLRNALLAAAPDLMGRGQQMSNLFSQRAGEWSQTEPMSSVTGADLAPELGATGEQDLFVYSVPAFTLDKSDRATLPLIRQDVTFDHLYTLDIAAVRDPRQSSAAQYSYKSPNQSFNNDMASGPRGGPDAAGRLAGGKVWHQIELANASSAPWTTGPVLVMSSPEGGANRGAVPIAQELLTYTPASGKALLPLTVAVDVRSELVEEELSREENALRRNSTLFTLVKARSTITLVSSRKEASTTRVTLSLGGRADKASDGGKVALTGHSSADWGNNDPGPVNNHSNVTWQVELAPGEKRELAVEFSYYTY